MLNLEQFIFILDSTTHSGNLGSVARIAKNMNITNIRLINPKANHLDEQAIAMSANAQDQLQKFTIYNSIEEAIADCSLVFATSARKRAFNPIIVTPDQIIKICEKDLKTNISKIQTTNTNNNTPLIAILFGPEHSGLTNHALQLANYHIVIDCNPEYTSLNLSMATLIIAYEIRKQIIKDKNNEVTNADYNQEALATNGEIQYFLKRLEIHLVNIGFTQHSAVMQRLYLLAYRSKITKKELAMLQGIITAQIKALQDRY